MVVYNCTKFSENILKGIKSYGADTNDGARTEGGRTLKIFGGNHIIPRNFLLQGINISQTEYKNTYKSIFIH